MFTGIVEELGTVVVRLGGRISVESPLVTADMRIGDSVALNGCCLTAVEVSGPVWTAEAVDETLARTNLGDLEVGQPVNLERPVRACDRLGGHLVQGHVDAVGVVQAGKPELVVSAPGHLLRYVAEKGSIAVDGVSLTVTGVFPDGFAVAVIPHTAKATTLGRRAVGDRVNLEVDVIAKYTERLLGGVAR